MAQGFGSVSREELGATHRIPPYSGFLDTDHDLSQKFTPIATESPFKRGDGSNPSFRFRNEKTKEAYILRPGGRDGHWDEFSRGDTWILNGKEDDSELSDHPTDAVLNVEADLAQFLDSEEMLKDGHTVVWYAGHFGEH